MSKLVGLFVAALVVVTAVCADQAPNSAEVQAPKDAPVAVGIMAQVQDALADPTKAMMAKNALAAGNSVLITKSNIIIRSSGDDKYKKGQVIQDLITNDVTHDDDNLTGAVLKLLNVSTPTDKLLVQIKALFQYRNDRAKLADQVTAVMNIAALCCLNPRLRPDTSSV